MTTALALSPRATAALKPLAPGALLPLDQRPARVYVAGLSMGSRRAMWGALGKIADLVVNGANPDNFPWHRLRFQHTSAVRAALQESYAASYARKMICALKGVLRAAWRLSQIATEDYQRAIDLSPIRGESLPRGRALTPGEIRALFLACAENNGIGGARDAALFGVLYGCGLRRSEAVALDLSDYNPKSGELKVRSGKGNKQRLAYVGSGGRDALQAWLDYRGGTPGPLFCALTPGLKLTFRRLNDQTIMDILLKRARQADISAVSPHDFRRTLIGDLLDAGADLVTVQKLAGHADVSTTARYDRRGEETKRKASELIHIPFVKIGKKLKGRERNNNGNKKT